MNRLNFRHLSGLVRRLLIAAPLALGLVAATLAESGSPAVPSSVTADPVSVKDTATPSSTTSVTVNGQSVPADTDGSVSFSQSSGHTQAQTSEGDVAVAVTESEGSSTAVQGQNDSHVKVNIDSDSNGGDGWSSARVYGFNSTNDGSSTSFSSTNVFSTGSGNVDVSAP